MIQNFIYHFNFYGQKTIFTYFATVGFNFQLNQIRQLRTSLARTIFLVLDQASLNVCFTARLECMECNRLIVN